MAQTHLILGTSPTGAGGMTRRAAFLACEDNFDDIYAALGDKLEAADLTAYCPLVDGLVPEGNLPGFVDDILEAANLAALPGTGETGKIYVTLDTNFCYRWSGSAYIQVGGGSAGSIATQEQAETGTDNATLMTPLRVAQAMAAQRVENGLPGVAYVFAATGDDDTGDGTLGKPWATAQKAYDEGFSAILAIGVVGSITGVNRALSLLGIGKDLSTFGTISGAGADITGNGFQMVTVNGISFQAANGAPGAAGAVTGANGDPGADGVDATPVVVQGLFTASSINLTAGAGGTGGAGFEGDPDTAVSSGNGGKGGKAGAGALLTVLNCRVTGDVISRQGNTGNGGNGAGGGVGFAPGNGGDAGDRNGTSEVLTEHSFISGNLSAPVGSAGSFGNGGPANGGGGSDGFNGSPSAGGFNGNVTLKFSEITAASEVAGVSRLFSIVGGLDT